MPLTTNELKKLTVDDFVRLKLTDNEKSWLREIKESMGADSIALEFERKKTIRDRPGQTTIDI